MLINKKTLCAAVLFLVIAAGFFATAHAQEYRFLAPLPGSGEAVQAGSEGFSSYMATVYWFFLSGAVILALVMLIIGGVEYVGSAGNTSLLQDAKGRMLNAILGLLLALISWLILNTINPDLVDFSLPIANINLPKTFWDGALTGGAGTKPPTTPPPGTPPAPVDGEKQPPPPPPPPPPGTVF
jgi:uncharacterized protein YybS (DUF2232 family)